MSCTRCGSTDHKLNECSWPNNVMLFAFLVLFLIVGPAWAIEVTLTDEEKAICAEQGGCFMVTQSILEKALRKAFNEGKSACNSST